ncbi:response regulator transcription factor [Streptomyces sp. NPDC006289]|uniref:response regulator transcription factor n=1 Tax=Streptomyces sp. NPDC006289 TaxID=3156744 RepID=UPI0033AFD608
MSTSRDARVRLLLIDDHTLVRDGLREILDFYDDLVVVGGAATSADGVAQAERHLPDIVLLDVQLPDGEVTETVRRIRTVSPASRIIILSMFDEPRLLRRLVTAGVRGYLLKSVNRHELVSAVRGVHSDAERMVLSVSRETLARMQSGRHNQVLSDRELEVLHLVAGALSNSQVADRLVITEATVKRHLRNIFARLGAVSRIDAVNKAVGASLITPGGPGRTAGSG